MSEQADKGAAGAVDDAAAAPAQAVEIKKVYVKDISFESPLVPGLFREHPPWRPEFNVQLNAESSALGEDLYEVVLMITVSAELEGRTAWLVEIKQAGLFLLRGFEQASLGRMLGSFCPNTLFPFAREAISELVTKGGLPAFLMAPINFDALYAQHMAGTGGAAQPASETRQ